MKPSNLWLYRALRGGVWERTKSCGWYRMRIPCGVVPPGTDDYEDHRDAQPLIVVCIGSIIGVSACAIIALAG
jgi:hypothetical protein